MKKYSFFGNLRFMMKKAWKNSRMAVLLAAFSVPFSIAHPFLLTLLSSKTVEYATGGVAETKLLLLISVLMLAITAATLLLRVINSFLPKYSLINRTKLGLEIKIRKHERIIAEFKLEIVSHRGRDKYDGSRQKRSP